MTNKKIIGLAQILAVIFLILTLSFPVHAADLPMRYTLDFYNLNGVKNVSFIKANVGNFTSINLNGVPITASGFTGGGWNNASTYTTTTLNVNITGNTTVSSLNLGTGTTAGTLNDDGTNVYINATGAVYLNGKRACLENGTYCAVSASGGNITGNGTINRVAIFTSATAISNAPIYHSAIGYGRMGFGVASPTSILNVNLSDTTAGTQFIIYNQNDQITINGMQWWTSGNSSGNASGTRQGKETMRIEARAMDNGGTYRQHGFIDLLAVDNITSGTQGSKFRISLTQSGTSTTGTAATFMRDGLTISQNNYDVMPTGDGLYVDSGNVNFTRNLTVARNFKLLGWSYPPCTSGNEGSFIYNYTSNHPSYCNSTNWVQI